MIERKESVQLLQILLKADCVVLDMYSKETDHYKSNMTIYYLVKVFQECMVKNILTLTPLSKDLEPKILE